MEHSDVRAKIEQLEERLMDERQELARLRAQLPPQDVGDIELDALGGRVRLQDAFGDREDLIVVHNMGAACRYCTLWADGFNGMLAHIESRTAFVVVSPDSPERQKAFAMSRGWKFTMLSDASLDFTRKMGFVRQEAGCEQLWPGMSTFCRSASGRVQRIGGSTFGPGDMFCPVWHLFGLLKGAAEEWEPKFEYEKWQQGVRLVCMPNALVEVCASDY
jgi:predicted dithiol-disulfide oxidoreductase (DUF899 family)